MWRTNEIYAALQRYEHEGRLITHIPYANSLIRINSAYYNNGRFRFQYSLMHGRLHGSGLTWYANGQLQHEVPFYKGILQGWMRSWYNNGQILCEVFYQNGQFHGRRREWYKDGTQKSECFYLMNQLEGLSTEWHVNGLVKEQISFLDGQRHGVWNEFDIYGKLISRKLYVRGVLISGRIARLIETGRLTARDILKIKNAAVRRICLEELGYARFLTGVGYEVIDRDGVQELVKIDWHEEEEPIYLVKVQCPSTHTFYTLRVPPHVRRVKQAVAWTFGVREEDYMPREET